jgi:hypothetical protein
MCLPSTNIPAYFVNMHKNKTWPPNGVTFRTSELALKRVSLVDTWNEGEPEHCRVEEIEKVLSHLGRML